MDTYKKTSSNRYYLTFFTILITLCVLPLSCQWTTEPTAYSVENSTVDTDTGSVDFPESDEAGVHAYEGSIEKEAIRSATIHITQAGGGDGSSEGSTRSAAWFNTPSSWGTEAGLIGPGDTVCFHGEITTPLVLQGSGSESEGTIQIVFNQGTPGFMNAPWIASTQTPLVPSPSVQVTLNGKNYITLSGIQFANTIHYGYLIAMKGNSTNIRIQDCRFIGDPNNAAVNAVLLNSLSIGLIIDCLFENIMYGINGGSTYTNNVTIKKCTILGSQTTTVPYVNHVSDIIVIGDAYNVLIEENYLSQRKSLGENVNDGLTLHEDFHCDALQTFKKGGGNAANPSNWIIRNNLIELNSTANSHRSFIMFESMAGSYYIYSNVFLGTLGGMGANGVCISRAASADFKLFFFNNTVIGKKFGPSNIISFHRSIYSSEIANNEVYNFFNNIVYSEQQPAYISPTLPVNFYRSNNIYWGGTFSNGGFCGSWIPYETHSQIADPLLKDYINNDFRLQPGSPAIDAAKKVENPLYILKSMDGKYTYSGAGWNIGAFENY